MDKFSHDLAAECQQDGIIVQSVMPTVLATKMYGLQNMSSMFVPKPETFVEANFLTLGIESRTAAYWVHKILVSFSKMEEILSLKYNILMQPLLNFLSFSYTGERFSILLFLVEL